MAMVSDSKPMVASTRLVWTQAKEQQLKELMSQKEKAYSEGAAAIGEILVTAGVVGSHAAMEEARNLIPYATALREALAPFDEKVQR